MWYSNLRFHWCSGFWTFINLTKGAPRPPYTPGLLDFTFLDWSMMEFDGAAVKRLQAVGVKPSTLGSSGTMARKLSNFSLKTSTDTLEMFLMDGGRQLNSLGPLTWKDCSLSFLTAGEPFRAGTTASLPLLSLCRACIPQLGTSSSRIFQVYIIRYLSNLLSCEFIFKWLNLCQ